MLLARHARVLVVFYLVTRLRFAFFHCLIHNTKEIRPDGGSIATRGDALFLDESRSKDSAFCWWWL